MTELELYHYGVKGMKWGVRKDRKDLKNLAKKYYNESKRKGYRDLKTIADSDTVSKLYNSDNVRSARNELRKYEKIREDFYNNGKLLDKYQRKCAKKMSEYVDQSYEDILNGYKYDDYDQGETGTFETWLRDTGKSKSYNEGYSQAAKQFQKACKETVDGYLKENGDMRVKDLQYEYKSNSWKMKTVNANMSKLLDDALNYRELLDYVEDR